MEKRSSSHVILTEGRNEEEPSGKCNLSGFAKEYVTHSDRRESTKENLYTTITVLQEFRPGLDFKDITYTFLKDFEVYLREKGNGINTVAKHLRQLRTLVNEAINQGYIHADAYPFRKFKIKQEKGRHEFLTPDELRKLENLDISDKKLRHVLDAFLFCCYAGLRFSDFCQLKQSNFIKVMVRSGYTSNQSKRVLNYVYRYIFYSRGRHWLFWISTI